jgi:signal transduction histidine kinase/CheY-like chemotaxis protein
MVPAAMHILLVEDERTIAAYIKRGLEEQGSAVDLAATGAEALAWCASIGFDLIILDVMLPPPDGLVVCRTLRGRGVATPLLMLTARDRVEDRVIGLDAGADDYLVKPFALTELLARVRALMRRTSKQKTPTLQIADLVLDPRTRRVQRGGRVIDLTAKEFAILECLMRSPGQICTRTVIADYVWSYETSYAAPVLEHGVVLAIVQVGRPLDDVTDTLHRPVVALLLSVPLLVLLAARGGYLLARRALRTIDAITRTAGRISSEDLHARLNLPPTDDEVGRLAATFDAMLTRLGDSFQRERQFTADASHELRTPLTAIQTILSVIRARRRTPEEYERALDDVSAATARLRTLVENLLLVARGDQPSLVAHDPLDLSLLLEDVIETLAPLAGERGLFIQREIAPALMTAGDRDQLARVFLNLLDNAIKLTENGVITVRAWRGGELIGVSVRDPGCGIAPEHLPHIFERFYRADAARSAGGSGLGLSIAREIVRAHSGQIAVRSAPGAGTDVTVHLLAYEASPM